MHEQPLGVIAGEIRLPDRDRDTAHEPREEQRALDLGARHGARVGEVAGPPPPDRERQGVATRFLMSEVHTSELQARSVFDFRLLLVMKSSLSLSKHLAHNLGNMLLLGK